MRISSDTIEQAFEKHLQLYDPKWPIRDHIKQWLRAERAFREHSFADFKDLYSDLKGKWQIGRGPNATLLSAEEVHRCLARLDRSFQDKRLRELAIGDMVIIWQIMSVMANVKRNKDGPSLVAVSKVLHFWNPRLFVIVDRQVMRHWVLKRRWIWDEVQALDSSIRARLRRDIVEHPDFQGPFSEYLPILLWASSVIRDNPGISDAFAKYVTSHANPQGGLPQDLGQYDAAAIEWLFLGLVELPPEGVTFP